MEQTRMTNLCVEIIPAQGDPVSDIEKAIEDVRAYGTNTSSSRTADVLTELLSRVVFLEGAVRDLESKTVSLISVGK